MTSAPPPAPRAPRPTPPAQPTLKLEQRLVLFQWMLARFQAFSFHDLAATLRAPELEHFDDEGVSLYHYELLKCLRPNGDLTREQLRRYDENIVRHWRAITHKRGDIGLMPKYFQYLMLLFTEIYLDRYFTDAAGLLKSLNAHIAAFDANQGAGDKAGAYPPGSLNKLAFWSATGSGKTLIMHVNLLQYRHYLKQAGRERELNRVLLLTPGEELSAQHIAEFALSGQIAAPFSRRGGALYAGDAIEVIEIQKLGDEMGDKVVAIDAFEGNNLVFVDEGHRGAGGEDWKPKRDQLCAEGFSFEYSATFGQAMLAARKPELTREYARCIVFDYSYRYFHADGYGKHYNILNIGEAPEETHQIYLTGCLLAFYQQTRLWQENRHEFAPFRIAPPLWIFVGGSVKSVRKVDGRDTTDVLDILRFLADFVHDRQAAVKRITRLLDAATPLMDSAGRDIFLNLFHPLMATGLSPESLYADALARVFHAPGPALLHVENLKGSDGEIALRVGAQNPAFGVISVGDGPELWKLCRQEATLVTTEQAVSESLFRGINAAESEINVLIGSKKFSAGWSSWRVSTMGLMRVGQSEGAEIIQLFGRGVRLQGYGFGLKRSSELKQAVALRSLSIPPRLNLLETLNVFGVRADYMKEFERALNEERSANASWETLTLPTIPEAWTASLNLKMLRLKPGIDFLRDGPRPLLALPDPALRKTPVKLDWHTKVDTLHSHDVADATDIADRREGKLEARHLAFLDWNALYFEIAEYVQSVKNWHNYLLPPERLRALLEDASWYVLLIPEAELAFTRVENRRIWQRIAASLLKKYCDRYYKHCKNAYEMPLLEYRPLSLTDEDDNFVQEYTVQVETSQPALVQRLTELRTQLEALKSGASPYDFSPVTNAAFRAFRFSRHFYYPLLSLNSGHIKVSPIALNEGERDFVLDLKRYYESRPPFFETRACYLLRNQSKKGIGFFEAGNFYPDFLLWLIEGDRQYLTFIDPKGLRNLYGVEDLKIQFHAVIKTLEQKLGDPAVTLNSYIVTPTKWEQVQWLGPAMTKADLARHHVLFQEDKTTYIEALLSGVIGNVLGNISSQIFPLDAFDAGQ